MNLQTSAAQAVHILYNSFFPNIKKKYSSEIYNFSTNFDVWSADSAHYEIL